jgi:S-adenosylmethionine hydrolase
MIGYGLPIQDNRIIYIDRYGNAMTAIDVADIGRDTVLSVNGSALHFARTFSEVPEGRPFWYGNSMGMVEIAVNRGSAASLLSLELGMPLHL